MNALHEPTNGLTTTEVARLAGVSVERVRGWALYGKLDYWKDEGERYRFREEDVNALLRAMKDAEEQREAERQQAEARTRLLTIQQLAERLQVSQRSIRRWLQDKGLPVVRLGTRTHRYDPDAVNEWLSERVASS